MKKPTCLILTGIGVLLLVLVLVFVVPTFVKVYEEMKSMLDKYPEYKHALREYANEPLSVDEEILLSELLEISGETNENLEQILSTEPYLTYLKTQNESKWETYSDYLAAIPTRNHKDIILTRLTILLGEDIEETEQEIWMKVYIKIRDWSKTGKNTSNNKEEFEEILQNEIVDPLSKNDTVTGFPKKIVEMGMVTALLISDSEYFHLSWHTKFQTYDKKEAYIRCAISTPDEFALMRSFFEDQNAFVKWITEPFPKEVENEEQVKE